MACLGPASLEGHMARFRLSCLIALFIPFIRRFVPLRRWLNASLVSFEKAQLQRAKLSARKNLSRKACLCKLVNLLWCSQSYRVQTLKFMLVTGSCSTGLSLHFFLFIPLHPLFFPPLAFFLFSAFFFRGSSLDCPPLFLTPSFSLISVTVFFRSKLQVSLRGAGRL